MLRVTVWNSILKGENSQNINDEGASEDILGSYFLKRVDREKSRFIMILSEEI